jgi:1-acyl-sn-glycerol-3-phosphate acyltransferase
MDGQERIGADGRDQGPDQPIDEFAAEVLRAIVTLAEELHPHQRGRPTPGLSGDLDRDFGLDSLGRVEAIHRLEALFNTTLPDKLFAEAGTPLDLVRAVREAGACVRTTGETAPQDRAAPAAVAAPRELMTLGDVLAWHAAHQGDRAHVYLSDGERETAPITYAQLYARAQRVAGGLVAQGVEPGDRVALMLATDEAYFAAFLGVVLAGAVPAPIYPPWRMQRLEEHLRRQARILDRAGASGLITFDAALTFGELLQDHAPGLRFVTTVEQIEQIPGSSARAVAKPEDLALLQFTSGSTADPKGVMLSHANIIANVRALAEAIRATPSDVFVSWLPLYHDMGLIAAWLACLDQAAPFVVMSPLSFMARPERWLWSIHRNRATISAAPNFAFELCLGIPDERLTGLDLSSLRVAGCGSEPISPQTIEDFTRKFAPYGFRPEALLPVYGLAESAAALTASPLGRPPRVDYVERRTLAVNGLARPVGRETPGAQAFVSCGAPLIGHEVRIVDPAGREAAERYEGRLQFRGPSATAGYFNDPAKTAELVADGWLESGDLAYIAEGEVFVTGRTKDVVKRAGRNIHPEDVEAAIEALAGVSPRGAVLFSAADARRGTERLVLVIETPEQGEAARQQLVGAAQERAADYLETAVDDIVLAAPETIPRTESGKVRRAALRELYLAGLATGATLSPRRQAMRLQATAAVGRLRRLGRRAAEWAYARYWWAVIGALGVMLWPLVLLLPSLHARWQVLHPATRLALKLLGHRLTVTREGPLPSDDVVYVANHSSYLDSVVLSAILPGDLAYAGFKDLEDKTIEGPFLRHLGAMFVERFEPQGALAAAEEALATLRGGRPIVIFPEATIMRMPGLLDFRMGAFAAAAQAGRPVVPITLRGTRNILRHDHHWFPRRGNIEAHIGRPIEPAGDDFEAALILKNAARADILAHVHEPDLAAETPLF